MNLGVVGTQGSQHNLGFTIGGQMQSNTDLNNVAYTSKLNLGSGLNLASESSRQNIAINIQSGASLAMRGHVSHDQGGIILEGKFMDTGMQHIGGDDPHQSKTSIEGGSYAHSNKFNQLSVQRLNDSAAQLDPALNLDGANTKQSKSRKPSIDGRGISPFSPQSSTQKVK